MSTPMSTPNEEPKGAMKKRALQKLKDKGLLQPINLPEPSRKKKNTKTTAPKKRKVPKKPPTENQVKTALRKQIREHNARACLKIPPKATRSQLEGILATRPVISKRPQKLTKAERDARRAANEKRKLAEEMRIEAMRVQNTKNQQQRMDAIIEKYGGISAKADKLAEKAGMVGTKENPMVLVPKRKNVPVVVGTKDNPMVLIPRRKKKQ